MNQITIQPVWATQSHILKQREAGEILDIVVSRGGYPVAFHSFIKQADGTFKPQRFAKDARVQPRSKNEKWLYENWSALVDLCLTFGKSPLLKELR